LDPTSGSKSGDMKVIFSSDIHASHTHFSALLRTAEKEQVDGMIIGGDIIPHYLPDAARLGHLKSAMRYLEEDFIPVLVDYKKNTGIRIYLDLGNDDFVYCRKVLEPYDGDLYHLIHFNKHCITDHVDIIGYMVVPPTPFRIKDWEKPDSRDNPYAEGNTIVSDGYVSARGILEDKVLDLTSDDTIEKDLSHLSSLIDRPFIFVSHSPPYHTPLDMIHNGFHVGSISIRRFIENWSRKGLLIASFHGHIHESPTRSGSIGTRIGNALCINPGQGEGIGSEFRYIVFNLSENRVFLFSEDESTLLGESHQGI
jgi:Icc-related predicted phosphoesterase